MRRRLVELANEQVSIVTVCQLVGVAVPDESGRRKVHCPFGQLYHSDGGRDPAMRINREANTAHCFNCTQTFSPVRLYAQVMDLSFRTAAVRLLEHVGHRPVDIATMWRQAVQYIPDVDKPLCADALKIYCRRTCPDWGSRQFESPVAATLTRCLALLDLVQTPDDVQLWLATCKAAMDKVLHPGAR